LVENYAIFQDVVPKGGDNWSHDPFLGEIITDENVDYIFGRGTIDDKQVQYFLSKFNQMIKV
jgi:hypothetical protein